MLMVTKLKENLAALRSTQTAFPQKKHGRRPDYHKRGDLFLAFDGAIQILLIWFIPAVLLVIDSRFTNPHPTPSVIVLVRSFAF
jgi:hypothetical protein